LPSRSWNFERCLRQMVDIAPLIFAEAGGHGSKG
jgi:hypothetical protein